MSGSDGDSFFTKLVLSASLNWQLSQFHLAVGLPAEADFFVIHHGIVSIKKIPPEII